jgi:hypothetical protein
MEFARQFRQQRLRRIEVDEGGKARGSDREAPSIESHKVLSASRSPKARPNATKRRHFPNAAQREQKRVRARL